MWSPLSLSSPLPPSPCRFGHVSSSTAQGIAVQSQSQTLAATSHKGRFVIVVLSLWPSMAGRPTYLGDKQWLCCITPKKEINEIKQVLWLESVTELSDQLCKQNVNHNRAIVFSRPDLSNSRMMAGKHGCRLRGVCFDSVRPILKIPHPPLPLAFAPELCIYMRIFPTHSRPK